MDTDPEIALQADGWDPSEVSRGSDRVLGWKCSSGHKTRARVANKVKRGGKCPVCTGRKVQPGLNDLATTHPDLAKQAENFDCTTVSSGSERKIRWKCDRGHQWESRIRNRSRGAGCPFCAGLVPIPGVNDLATTDPKIALELVDADPTQFSRGSSRRVRWRCQFGHNWLESVNKRVIRGFGCPFCSGKRLLVGFNDLATTHPLLANELLEADPTTLTKGSHKKVMWICQLGHCWMSAVNGRVSGSGCPICSGNRVLQGFNDVASRYPVLAKEAFGWDPSSRVRGSEAELRWKCADGHIYKASLGNRLKGSGCPYCSGRLPIQGANDLSTTHPILASEAFGWDPSTVKAGTNEKKTWRCQDGHQWKASVASRALAGSGCPSCANFGFKPELDAWLYLMADDQSGFLQVGITNDPRTRLKTHARRGWDLIDVYGPVAGDIAQYLENGVLSLLKSKGVSTRNKRGTLPNGRRAESWLAADFPVTNLGSLLKEVRDHLVTD